MTTVVGVVSDPPQNCAAYAPSTANRSASMSATANGNWPAVADCPLTTRGVMPSAVTVAAETGAATSATAMVRATEASAAPIDRPMPTRYVTSGGTTIVSGCARAVTTAFRTVTVRATDTKPATPPAVRAPAPLRRPALTRGLVRLLPRLIR